MKQNTLPVIADGTLSRYMDEIKKFPLLEEEEEYMLATAWRDRQDKLAAHKLVTSHLRLVAKIAMGYRGYGLPLVDLISEGNIGLMQAVKRFEPEKGFRLSTYAMWWIKASIQEYVLRSWSLVKMGTTAAQKKLFFNLRRMRNRITNADSRLLRPDELATVAKELDVSVQDVEEMDQRMHGNDYSLNAYMGGSEGESETEWMDQLADEGESHEKQLGDYQEMSSRKAMLKSAISRLNEREQTVLAARRLREEPATLEELSQLLGVSRERVRQIEVRALEKLEAFIKAPLPAKAS